MSDWEEVRDDNTAQPILDNQPSQSASTSPSGSDWEEVIDQPDVANQSKPAPRPLSIPKISATGFPPAIGTQPFNALATVSKMPILGSSLIESGENLASNILHGVPSLLKSLIQGIPSLYNDIQQNPQAVAKQALAGTSEFGERAFNMPHDFINYLASQGALPESVNKLVQMGRMPADTQNMINQMFGQPQTPGESMVRSGFKYTPEVLMAGQFGKNMIKNVANLIKPINPDEISQSIQQNHDILKSSAQNDLNFVENEFTNRGLNPIPVKFNLMNKIKRFLPNTPEAQQLFNNASKGNFKALRDLSSYLFDKGTQITDSSSLLDIKKAAEMMSARDEINNTIFNDLKNQGHSDLATTLRNGMDKWKELEKTYYGDNTPTAIKNLVHPKSRKMPTDIIKTISERSKPMDRILNQNPLARQRLAEYQNKMKTANQVNSLTKLMNKGLTLAGAGYLATHGSEIGKFIEDELTDKEKKGFGGGLGLLGATTLLGNLFNQSRGE